MSLSLGRSNVFQWQFRGMNTSIGQGFNLQEFYPQNGLLLDLAFIIFLNDTCTGFQNNLFSSYFKLCKSFIKKPILNFTLKKIVLY